MTFLLLMAGAAVNTIQCVFIGGVVFVGFVFYLVGLAPTNSSQKRFSHDKIKFTLTVSFTLSILILYAIIAYWNVRTAGTLAFDRPDSTGAYLAQAKQMVLWGTVQGAYAPIAFVWLLPRVIGEVKLDKKHIWIISAGALLAIAGGGAAWLTV
ncbi:hypothetical protein M5X00_07065 [Paenibacillus alvei]|uniref:Uncharacterized protein n=1 Tax=Paenibacillus alvei TaxID=44250 RepID=A0ABT4GZU6_PAEAL|nr:MULTISPECIES: hypothetical protein [Paenibacillus]MCY9544494.1 hypothetical protein [Paenibacillus alvei]MCY9702835.1 hypothetical protein [Paenibacillus alvei]MCY9733149.1 hypothetical protein [Paenibacillus alvei]MCY9754015.1 hypothetical protein [Paenibacillus alvei]MCY9762257.1 hypothetical protein [Paenibacillus alvei]